MKNLDDISVLTPHNENNVAQQQRGLPDWRGAWKRSLRFRLLALGMMPLLLAFPLVMVALSILGGDRAEEMLLANLRSQLGASSGYLEQARRQTGNQLGQLVRSERMRALLHRDTDPKNVQRVLAEVAESSNLDYLLLIEENGRILATHSGQSAGMRLPPDHVLEQAREGVVTSAFEWLGPNVLELLGKDLRNEASVRLLGEGRAGVESRGLVIHAAAHFPLAVDSPNAMLVGGILLNRNAPMVEHMRELVYPVGTLPDNNEGLILLAVGDTIVTIAKQDHTQRLAQKTIADEASRRRALFEHERDGVIILNEDGSVFEANPSAAQMLGYTMDELHRMNVAAWEAKFSAAEVAANIRASRKEGEIIETVHRRKDGTTYVAELTLSKVHWGDRTFILTSQRDISERKAVEAELDRYRLNLELLVEQRTRELNDRTAQLDTIFALSPDGMVSFDRLGNVASVNQAFLQMTGLERSMLAGLDEQAFETVLRTCCRDPHAFGGFETLRGHREQGGDEPRPVLEMAGPGGRVLEFRLKSSGSAFVSQVLYIRDITRESEVDRMKSEFLTTAAHELRTPMASICGFSELLLLRKFSDEKRREMLETISRQATLMSAIINELLDLARIEARRGQDFVMETVAVQDIVRLVATDYKPPEGRALPILSASDAPLYVRADRGKLQQAILNVLSNAYKYSPQGGDVVINCQPEGDGQHVLVTVRDQGMGMSSEQVQRVFERFYRADASGHIPGTGLGMSIVKEIIEIMGGKVSVDSEPDAGTTVTLRLPVVPSAGG